MHMRAHLRFSLSLSLGKVGTFMPFRFSSCSLSLKPPITPFSRCAPSGRDLPGVASEPAPVEGSDDLFDKKRKVASAELTERSAKKPPKPALT